MPSIIIAYIPVLHQGYLQFFAKHKKARELYILGHDFTQPLRALQKDIRAVEPELMQKAIESLNRFDHVEVLRTETIAKLQDPDIEIIMPEEDLSREIAEKYFVSQKVQFDSIFLRWDRSKMNDKRDVEPDVEISEDEFHRRVIERLELVAEQKSSDFWRQVGAAIFDGDEELAFVHNQHRPYHMQQYVLGDPRGYLHRGEGIEFTSSIHAEAKAIADLARQGISTEGKTMYVSTFPCPVCAKLVAEAGIKKLYYSGGYAILDGAEVMKAKGVEIVKVLTRE